MDTTSNAFAVYSTKPVIRTGKLLSLAKDLGLQVRLLRFGGFPIPASDTMMKGKLESGLLLAVWPDADSDTTKNAESLIAADDRMALGQWLKKGPASWFELYSRPFSLEEALKPPPKGVRKSMAMARRIKQLQPKTVRQIRGAKTRYVWNNMSRKRPARELMLQLTEAVRADCGGLLIEHLRPK